MQIFSENAKTQSMPLNTPTDKIPKKHALSKREQKQKGTKILTVKVKIKSR